MNIQDKQNEYREELWQAKLIMSYLCLSIFVGLNSFRLLACFALVASVHILYVCRFKTFTMLCYFTTLDILCRFMTLTYLFTCTVKSKSMCFDILL